MTRNYNSRPKWVPGYKGPVNFIVKAREMTWPRHLDEICETNVYTAVVSDSTFVPQPTTNTDATNKVIFWIQ